MQKKPSPLLLRGRVLAEAARVVAEVLRARRLDAGEDPHGFELSRCLGLSITNAPYT